MKVPFTALSAVNGTFMASVGCDEPAGFGLIE
ncbi:hypothetical protein KALB_7124 [Kutzneria albida DSM 43870]|uniref:Uncharacterized protein n=1 Tax=Kutzneria albida DSM 43870 TaxID=1449976 RepID=W5WIQ8_9PSEU|nr:hypothetical protein KALB_7124 [Kutzneria albida DSM 43870]